MVVKKEALNRKLWPAEIKRGIKEGWVPKYFVVVSGEASFDGAKDSWTDKHDWLIENTTGFWMDHIYQPEYLVGFENAEDAIAFKLRWL